MPKFQEGEKVTWYTGMTEFAVKWCGDEWAVIVNGSGEDETPVKLEELKAVKPVKPEDITIGSEWVPLAETHTGYRSTAAGFSTPQRYGTPEALFRATRDTGVSAAVRMVPATKPDGTADIVYRKDYE